MLTVRNALVAALAFFIFVILPSDVIHALLGVKANLFFAAALPICIVIGLTLSRGRVSKNALFLCGMVVVFGCLATAIAGSYTQLLIALAFAGSLLVVSTSFDYLVQYRCLFYINCFAWMLLAGAVLGLVYSMSGGVPILDLRVEDRTLALFLTTFAERRVDEFIRPTAIFNEPGALAMFVTVILVLNHQSNAFKISSVSLAIALIFVGSLAGAVVCALYFLTSTLLTYRAKVSLILVLIFIVIGVFALRDSGNAIVAFIDGMYFERLRIQDGWLAGDNRSAQVLAFFERVNEQVVWRGGLATGVFSDVDVSSNPFSMIASHGILISIPYFYALAWLVAIMVKEGSGKLFASLAMFFTLLQRPYLLYFPWSAMLILALFSLRVVRKAESRAI